MYGSLTDCPQGLNDPTHVCGRDCSSNSERSNSKRSSNSLKLSISKKTRSPTRSPTRSLSPSEGVEQPLLPLSDLQSSLKVPMADRELSDRSCSVSSRGSSSYSPLGDVNSSYHGFVGDDDPTFSIVSRVSAYVQYNIGMLSLVHNMTIVLCFVGFIS